MNNIKWLLIVVLAIALIMGVGVYRNQQNQGLSDVELVEIRTMGWLQAMIAKDWGATYPFTSPGYRSGVTQYEHERTMGLRRVQWLGAELIATSCETEICRQDIRVVYKVTRPLRGVPEFKSFEGITKTWIKQDGEWWLSSSG